VQQRHGKDKLAVVLLSVDPGYFGESKSYISQAEKILKRNKIDWPSAFLPGGWNDCARAFNLSGYGLVLVDAQGVVRSINPRGEELEAAVERVLGEEKPAR
jgi:hypothetical protein